MPNELLISIAIAFAAGSIPFGWIIAKLWGIEDLTKVGSSNIGATNVVRTAGPVPGALTFLLDFLKGILPMIYLPSSVIWVGLAAVAGHCFSPFLRLRGGKGVSTALGAFMAYSPWLGGGCIVAYGLSLAVTRVSALGSLFAMLTALVGAMIFALPDADKIGILIIVLIVLVRHKDNWNKLLGNAGLTALLFALLTPALSTVLSYDSHAMTAPLKDFRGRQIEMPPTKPKRVAALIPSLAETVIDLGAGAQLIAAPDYTRYPADFQGKVARLGPYNSISPEVVYAAKPDLVLASMDGNDPVLVEKLDKLGLNVVVLNTRSLADIERSMELVGVTLANPSHPKLSEFRKLLSQQKPNQASGPRVFVQIGWDPLVTISQTTFIDELVRLSGGQNVFSDAPTAYPRPNAEEVLARNPDVIVICQLTDSGNEAARAKAFWSRFKQLKAVKNNKIHVMPTDWLTKPGFNLMNGVKELRRVL